MMFERFSSRSLAIGAGAGSALLLAAALSFQAAGYAPCELCILQRWPHLAAVVIAALAALSRPPRLWTILGTIAAAAATAFAAYHVGVEQGWWPGPSACTGGIGDIAAMSTTDLLNRIRASQVVRCDQPAWMFLGLSMAAWNALFSAGLAVIWAVAAGRRARG